MQYIILYGCETKAFTATTSFFVECLDCLLFLIVNLCCISMRKLCITRDDFERKYRKFLLDIIIIQHPLRFIVILSNMARL